MEETDSRVNPEGETSQPKKEEVAVEEPSGEAGCDKGKGPEGDTDQDTKRRKMGDSIPPKEPADDISECVTEKEVQPREMDGTISPKEPDDDVSECDTEKDVEELESFLIKREYSLESESDSDSPMPIKTRRLKISPASGTTEELELPLVEEKETEEFIIKEREEDDVESDKENVFSSPEKVETVEQVGEGKKVQGSPSKFGEKLENKQIEDQPLEVLGESGNVEKK